MYRNRQEMAARRKFKALEKTTWFRARRGGKEATEQKDVPSAFKRKPNPDRQQETQETRESTPEKETRTQADSGRKPKSTTTAVETVAFIPYTPDSALKSLLQKADDELTATLRKPRIRFVERGGSQIVMDVGRPNPWASDFYCSRKECQVCSGRSVIG